MQLSQLSAELSVMLPKLYWVGTWLSQLSVRLGTPLVFFQHDAAVITPGEDASQLVERQVEGSADAVSPPWCGDGFYSQSPLSVHSWCLFYTAPLYSRMR